MIDPDALLVHAGKLAGVGRGRPPEVNLRRRVSAAYYSVFHDITRQAAQHLIGAASVGAQSSIRRTWTQAEKDALCRMLVDRHDTLVHNAGVPPIRELLVHGPLPDLAARDALLVDGLRGFSILQDLRHQADYDHETAFDKAVLVDACQRASAARGAIASAGAGARQAFFTLLTVSRANFSPR